MERHTFWANEYSQLDDNGGLQSLGSGLKWEYTQQGYATFPRYLVWEAILNEVERLRPEASVCLDDLQHELASAGMRAQTMMTTNPGLPAISVSAMDEERDAFRKFILSVPESLLLEVEAMPMRRGFDPKAIQQVWDLLHQHWDVTAQGYWWPLREETPSKPVLAFHTDWFDSEKIATVRDVLTAHGVTHIWEVREFGQWGCEQRISDFDPIYNGEEGYWTSKGGEWLVYASHESSISIGGDWLVRGFRRVYPDCDQFQYRGPMSTTDRRGEWTS